jgi:hypothetical protein
VTTDDGGAGGGIKIGRENQSTQRKPAPVPLSLLQIPHDLGSNTGLRYGKTVTNRLCCDIAFSYVILRYCPYQDYKAENGRIFDELERIWEEAAVTYSRYYRGICL